jgi:hypothetical protein
MDAKFSVTPEIAAACKAAGVDATKIDWQGLIALLLPVILQIIAKLFPVTPVPPTPGPTV